MNDVSVFANEKVNLLEFSLPELEEWFAKTLNQPKFRAHQVWQWIWQKLAQDFGEMTNVSCQLRKELDEVARIGWPRIIGSQTGKDGTTKFLLGLEDGKSIETVLIPSWNRDGQLRWAQCLSSQVGCAMGCTFCATGQMGFERNLSRGEILGQVLVGKEYLNDRRPDWPVLRNLVFMGMGEPLLNLQALIPALETLQDDRGLNFSPRRITVSTCGIERGLKILGESGLAFLAISLHAANQPLRQVLMPKAAGWSLDKMMEALKKYPLKTRERVTFEYLLLGGVNDSVDNARELARLISGIKAKLNIITYNEVPGLPYKAPTEKSIREFLDFLRSKNITAILRKSKGAEIAAACGQLHTELIC